MVGPRPGGSATGERPRDQQRDPVRGQAGRRPAGGVRAEHPWTSVVRGHAGSAESRLLGLCWEQIMRLVPALKLVATLRRGWSQDPERRLMVRRACRSLRSEELMKEHWEVLGPLSREEQADQEAVRVMLWRVTCILRS